MQVPPLMVLYNLYSQMDFLQEFSPLHTERKHGVAVAEFSTCHRLEQDSGVLS